MARLSHKHEVVAVRVTDPSDTELPAIGTIPFKDSETGDLRLLPTSSSHFARVWFDDNRQRSEFWQTECMRHGSYPLTLSTTEDPLMVLSRFFSQRGRT